MSLILACMRDGWGLSPRPHHMKQHFIYHFLFSRLCFFSFFTSKQQSAGPWGHWLHQLRANGFLHNRLKPMHNIGKVSVNASILYKNQEICNNTNLWKFQLISLFLLRENSKNAFSIFVLSLMAGVFVSRDENSLLDLISLIIRER